MKTIKEGVNLLGLQPVMFLAWEIANEVYMGYGVAHCTITSAADSTHGMGSLHYAGYAVDLRTREFPEGGNNSPLIDKVVEDLRHNLGEQYDVVRESNHLHVEFQPKK